MYERILFPTDGSEGSEIVLEHAIDLAKRYDATLEGLFVGDQRTYAGMAADIDREQIKEAQASVSEQALDRVRSAAEDAGVDVETTHTSGVPAEKIVEVVEEDDADLVVMGTHGRTGIDHYLIGSIAERVVRQSPVPVVTVRIDEN